MTNKNFKYCNNLIKYSRFKTRVVNIGGIPLGGNYPVRIQSMTTTNTLDTKSTVKQSIRMIEAGCEYIRITAPSINEAENLKNIKEELKKNGYSVPLIADIHFTPNAAEVAARIVEKVRVNPGNYVDKKKFFQTEYTDKEYEAEIERIQKRFSPLVKVCKEYGTAMRIGTNHGSLSDRIMSRYGDTPLGMVESALEFVRICEDLNYHDIVLSMKASNTQIMVEAYRLLVNKMIISGRNYPIHLGVTEAGDGEDGRIKSALGIGALLEDGIGDTIRVSLTEEPEKEIPVAIALVKRYENRENHDEIPSLDSIPKNPFEYAKRKTFQVNGIGGKNVPVVIADFSKTHIKSFADLSTIGYNYNPGLDKWNMNDTAADFIYLGKQEIDFELPNSLKAIYDSDYYKTLKIPNNAFPLFTIDMFEKASARSDTLNFVELTINDIFSEKFNNFADNESVVFVITTSNLAAMAEQRRAFFEFMLRGVENPVIIKRNYCNINANLFRLHSSTDFGALLIDGFGEGVWANTDELGLGSEKNTRVLVNRTLFGILQAARTRISKTEYIACPSCGRTLFDLVEVTNKIRKRTEHLKGMKIGIMGCIVNGPGEMADADYGYVGSGIDKITLYRGKEVVMKNINFENAVDKLIGLIKEDGNWVEPK
ncbi:4-hydroxy-3-methylbut-2-en-1-yl diphosphate synthase [bacterium BMS3Abin04]|nr:4-hydroxy-3-methylbut-2-en-1-yl diphosphate synthase [bacterium BMS3Abin04]